MQRPKIPPVVPPAYAAQQPSSMQMPASAGRTQIGFGTGGPASAFNTQGASAAAPTRRRTLIGGAA
jgi:hypothetical protein